MNRFPLLSVALLIIASTIAGGALAQEQTPPVDKVRAWVTSMAPAGVRVTELKVAGKRILLRGTSGNTQQVSQLLRSIDSAGGVSSLNLETIEAIAGGHRFSLYFDVDCSDPAGRLCTAPTRAKAVTVHKCEVGGRIVFQDRPCAAAAIPRH